MHNKVHIKDFADRLASIREAEFTHNNVLQFVRNNVVDCASLGPYLWFSEDHYTRNLILKTKLFELLAIGWDIGQKSPIHNHRDQNCWMAIPYGKLQVHNFALIQKEPSTRFCELRSSGQILIDPENPTEVDPEEPIHQVLNPSSFGSKAVSLHIYSRPFDSCEVYDLKEKRYQDVPLINTTEYGNLVDTSLRCQRFTL
jgi:cysteine dioxygenase